MLPQFLERLMKKTKENNLVNRIVAEEMLMDNLTFEKKSFDVIWSEGAIYNISFEKGLSLWRRSLAKNKWRYVQHYADAKTSIVQEIMERANAIK